MIEVKNLTKVFTNAHASVEVLDNISFTVPDGDIFGIIGMSGAGKSTLVRCMNMLEKPTEGSIIIDGVDMGTLSPKELREKRREITMIFQNFNLLMQRNCLANVRFPLELEGKLSKSEANAKALELLETVGLKDKAKSYPSQLSGGQQQRVAIARALATNPKVLLCDEATSALDPKTTSSILSLLKEINSKFGITIIIITHQMSVIQDICDHVAVLDQGKIEEMGEVGKVFSDPKSAITKRFVFPDGDIVEQLLSQTDEYMLKVLFNGAEATNTPLIARMAIEKGIEANILYASTKSLQNKVYGTMILGIGGDHSNVEEAIKFYDNMPNIIIEEVAR